MRPRRKGSGRVSAFLWSWDPEAETTAQPGSSLFVSTLRCVAALQPALRRGSWTAVAAWEQWRRLWRRSRLLLPTASASAWMALTPQRKPPRSPSWTGSYPRQTPDGCTTGRPLFHLLRQTVARSSSLHHRSPMPPRTSCSMNPASLR